MGPLFRARIQAHWHHELSGALFGGSQNDQGVFQKRTKRSGLGRSQQDITAIIALQLKSNDGLHSLLLALGTEMPLVNLISGTILKFPGKIQLHIGNGFPQP